MKLLITNELREKMLKNKYVPETRKTKCDNVETWVGSFLAYNSSYIECVLPALMDTVGINT